MKIWEYKDEEEYRQNQYQANIQKLDRVWVKEWHIEMIGLCVKSLGRNTKSILCHGTRNGTELKYFKTQFPNARIIGTEISPTAKQFPNTIRHDFQKTHPRLVGKFDIVFSNSLDHSRDPIETLKVWKDQLKDTQESMMWLDVAFDDINNSACEWDPLQWDNREEFENVCEQIGLRFVFKIVRSLNTDDGFVVSNLYGLKKNKKSAKKCI